MPTEPTVEEQWYQMLTEGEPTNGHLYHLYGLLPSNPRCKLCAAPFKSWGITKVLVQRGFRVFGSVRKTQDAQRLTEEFGKKSIPPLLTNRQTSI
ncbi:MAG TPA: hypothetical protein VI753_01475 [Anaerolineales bacterium]|nr:hypothetical protein [Anaerolineales bacterium]